MQQDLSSLSEPQEGKEDTSSTNSSRKRNLLFSTQECLHTPKKMTLRDKLSFFSKHTQVVNLKFISILERIYKGDVGRFVCAYPDRAVRFGFPLIEWLCQQAGCELVVLNERKLSPERELVEDILSILHCFSARLYGLRKYKAQVQEVLQDKAPQPNLEEEPKRNQEDPSISI
jgi:hypothetical protein